MNHLSLPDPRWKQFLMELHLERNAPVPARFTSAAGSVGNDLAPITPQRAAHNAAVLERETAAWERGHVGENRRHLRAVA